MRLRRDGWTSLFLSLLFLEDDVDRLNGPLVMVGLAVNDNLMNARFDPRHIDGVLFGKTVVPALYHTPKKSASSW
jgi:hypothetical protein